MIAARHAPESRSCAQSLVRFAEALKRARRASEGGSLERAHTPHTPLGRALKRRPGSLVRARSSAQASERSPMGVVGPCGGKARMARRANPAARTRHGGTWAAWAGRGREDAGEVGRHRYFRGGMASRRPREQPQSPTEFVSLVRWNSLTSMEQKSRWGFAIRITRLMRGVAKASFVPEGIVRVLVLCVSVEDHEFETADFVFNDQPVLSSGTLTFPVQLVAIQTIFILRAICWLPLSDEQPHRLCTAGLKYARSDSCINYSKLTHQVTTRVQRSKNKLFRCTHASSVSPHACRAPAWRKT